MAELGSRLKKDGMTKADDLIICRCEEVTLGEIRQAIKDGARTVCEVKWRTRAGMGLCQGNSCRQIVSQIICEETELVRDEVYPATFRPPVRPVLLGVLASGGKESDNES